MKLLQRNKKLKPNYILFYKDKKTLINLKIVLVKFFIKKIASKGSRNPFNRDKMYYDGYLYEFKFSKLPECLIKN